MNFRNAFQDYRRCLVNLLPTNFDQISRSKIHFDSGKFVLDEDAMELLDLVAIYMKGDREVNEVYIDGYTDDVGRKVKNVELSKNRAETVLAYLVSAGVPDELISTRYHGQHYPLAKNTNAANRAKNRRVTIRLDKVPVEEMVDDDEIEGSGLLEDS
ncbi:MAG: OmpA family protein [Pseudomonadales bacterium]|nr:OmpA family protein [Pseudomonadales bacterium]